MTNRIFILALLMLGLESRELYEGSKCRNPNDSRPGVCTPVPDCPVAIHAISLHRSHDLKRCGFDRFTEIVCCPKGSLATTTEPSLGEDYSDNSNNNNDNNNSNNNNNKQAEVRSPQITSKSKKACESYSKNIPISLSYHIVNGENAELGEFPHMVALGFFNPQDQVYKFDCGGTLISNNYVITAAHCIINVEQNELKIARLGVIDVPESVEKPDPKIDYNVINVTVHKEYNWKEKFNDIALIKLEKQVTFTDSIRPACLHTKSDDPQNLMVTGWGAVKLGGDKSQILQKAILTSVPLNECNSTYLARTKRKVIKSQICAADDRSDACQGDSGGPLQIQSNSTVLTIVGITSYGIGCGSKYPGIYTRVSSYLDWIEGIVWP